MISPQTLMGADQEANSYLLYSGEDHILVSDDGPLCFGGSATNDLASATWLELLQFSSVSLSRVRLCDPMNYRMPGLPVHHQLPESTQTHVH